MWAQGKQLSLALPCMEPIRQVLQSALMVPTEILAEQHIQSLQGFSRARGSAPNFWDEAADKKVALSKIESGEAQMIVGTHH